jgi:hypothetical protein
MPNFDPDKYLASEDFNPDEYLSKVQQPRMTPLDAGISKLSQGLTLGYADELLGGIETAGAEVGERLGLAEPKDAMQRYREFRNIHRARAAQAEQDQPEVALGAELVGSGVTAFSPVGAALTPVRGAGALANTARVVGGGALAAGGGSSAELTTNNADQYQEFAKDVGTGAALNSALTAAGKPIGYVAGKFSPSYLSNMAEQRAVKSAIGQNKKAFKDLKTSGTLNRAGRELLEATDDAGNPVLGWFSNSEDILPGLQQNKSKVGQQIGEVSNLVDQAVPQAIDNEAIARNMQQELAKIPEIPSTAGKRNQLKKEIDAYMAKGKMSFSDAQKYKSAYPKSPMNMTPAQQRLGMDTVSGMRASVGKEMEDAAAKLAADPKTGPETADKLRLYENLKKKYADLLRLEEGTDNNVTNMLSNRFVQPSDYLVGGLTAATELGTGNTGVVTAGKTAATTAINKQLRERGSAFAARTADKLAKIMAADPAGLNRFRGVLEDAARRGPQALMLTHTLLSEDPEYQQTLESQP